MDRENHIYRLAALDMDGTLLNSEHVITPYTREVLRKAAEAGRVVALCTGRCLAELWKYLDENPAIGYVIGESGGCLYDARKRRTIRQLTLPEDVAERILEAAAGYDACVQAFFDNRSCMYLPQGADFGRYRLADLEPVFRETSIFVEDMSACWQTHGRAAEKINLYFTSEEDRERFRPVLAPFDLGVFDSMGIGFELSPAGVTKAAGLAALCAHLGFDPADAMAVGDSGNDVDVMRSAGFSVAMGNATQEVRDLADAVTEDCDHDGAARAMVRHMGLGEI